MVPFVEIKTGRPVRQKGNCFVDSSTDSVVARIDDDIPRFIKDYEDYAHNFGYQWNKWNAILSDSRNEKSDNSKFKLIVKRTRFDQYETQGKTILECGCGGGDDTEILLKFPFSEVHSFDLSRAVDRVKKFITDDRLVLSQASIFDIPYADRSFDFVFCHRVLQHTPDPEKALRSVAKKVKLGGVMFVHSYHRSFRYMMHFKYKYRFLTRRLPHRYIEGFLDRFAPLLYTLNERLYKHKWGRLLGFNFVPLEYTSSFANFGRNEIIELAKLITFDALTPTYDKPMKWSTMKGIVEDEGFKIEHYNDNPKGSPIYLTAMRIR